MKSKHLVSSLLSVVACGDDPDPADQEPVAATELVFTHHANVQDFALDPSSIYPRPSNLDVEEETNAGLIRWTLRELGPVSRTFRYRTRSRLGHGGPELPPAAIVRAHINDQIPGGIDKIITGGLLGSGQPLPTPGEIGDILSGGLWRDRTHPAPATRPKKRGPR